MGALKDTDRMMFGKHEGKQMIDVPASYLIWAYENITKLRGDMREYIESRMEWLIEEAKQEKK